MTTTAPPTTRRRPPRSPRRAPLLASLLLLLLASLLGSPPAAAAAESGDEQVARYAVDVPKSLPSGTPVSIKVDRLATAPDGSSVQLEVAGSTYDLSFEAGTASAEDVVVESGGDITVRVLEGGSAVPFTPEINPVALGLGEAETVTAASVDVLVPGWVTVVPALLAIGLALAFKKVLPALLGGVWLAAWIGYGFSPLGLGRGLLDVFEVYIAGALAPADGDQGHVAVILFTFFVGGTVGIITRNGGTVGLVERFTSIAKTPGQAQAATGALGVGIFFGGYTSSLIVGNAMRPVTDSLRVSREKLAYSVDSTASPIATLMIVSTWVGYQVGLIDDAISQVDAVEANAYAVFLQSIPYSFYAFMAILMVFCIALLGRDYGPMLKAERRARGGQVERDDSPDEEDAQQEAGSEAQDLVPKQDAPARMFNAVVPIGVLVVGVVVALLATGDPGSLWERIGSADSSRALVYSSAAAMLTAFVLTLGQRIMTLSETIDAWFTGVKSVLFILFILTLAWSLSAATQDLHTGEYLANLLGDAIPPLVLPALIFVLAAGIAFSVGTSWGTMGILTPLVVPLAYTVLSNNDMMAQGELPPLFLASIAAVLGGAVWGDHSSPISDTTIISALSSGCEVVDHTRTQLPYALMAAVVGVLVGHIPVGLGVPWWLALPACAVVTVVGVLLVGKKTEDGVDTEDDGSEDSAAEKSAAEDSADDSGADADHDDDRVVDVTDETVGRRSRDGSGSVRREDLREGVLANAGSGSTRFGL